jgi:hypothetical protein
MDSKSHIICFKRMVKHRVCHITTFSFKLNGM